MTTPVAHPLIDAYLRDLEMLLHGVDPVERAEVLAGVHEHLEVSLASGASDDDILRTLSELGSPQSVADEAYAGRPPLAVPARPRPSPWTAHVACFINGVGLAFLALLTVAGALTSGFMAPHPAELVFMGMAFVIPWFVLLVLTSMSEVWRSADKFRSILLYPVTFVALAMVAWVAGLAQVGALTLAGGTPVIVGAVWILVSLVRSART